MSRIIKPDVEMHNEILRVRDLILDRVVIHEKDANIAAQGAIFVWAGLLRVSDPNITNEQAKRVAGSVIDYFFKVRSN